MELNDTLGNEVFKGMLSLGIIYSNALDKDTQTNGKRYSQEKPRKRLEDIVKIS